MAACPTQVGFDGPNHRRLPSKRGGLGAGVQKPEEMGKVSPVGGMTQAKAQEQASSCSVLRRGSSGLGEGGGFGYEGATRPG